jgi:D-alanyl-D-alanine carboxypeptidase
MIFTLSASQIFAQQMDLNLASAFQATIDSVAQNDSIVGISAGVYIPEQGIWKGTSGYVNVEDSILLDTADTMFFGSITKTFTAVLALVLAEEGKLILSEPITKYLPNMSADAAQNITIDHCLQHTAGFQTSPPIPRSLDSLLNYPDIPVEPEAILVSYDLAPVCAPGWCFHYSNVGYLVLGVVAEKVVGEPFGKQIHERFFGPLNMPSALVPIYDPIPSQLPEIYSYEGTDKINNVSEYISQSFLSASFSAGTILGRPGDLISWLRGLFNGDVVSPEVLQKMKTICWYCKPDAQTIEALNLGNVSYGYGLMRIDNPGGTPLWGHSGGYKGISSQAFIHESSGIVVVAMTNQSDAYKNGKPVAASSLPFKALLRTVDSYFDNSANLTMKHKARSHFLHNDVSYYDLKGRRIRQNTSHKAGIIIESNGIIITRQFRIR